MIGLVLAVLCSSAAGWAQQYTITTYAGNGIQGYFGYQGPPAGA